MSDKRSYKLVNAEVRSRASADIWQAPDGYEVVVRKPGRSLDQNALFHSLVGDIAKSGFEWAGRKRTAEEIKVLVVSGHTMATSGEPGDIVPGLEGEPCQLRESTAAMSKQRLASLIDYTEAFMAGRGIKISTPRQAER